MENRVYYGQYSLRHWIDLILKRNIILPEYQRFFVWNESKAKTLIRTLKDKKFVPPVTIGAFKMDGDSQNLILDGQQRLTSILLAYLGIYPDEATYKKKLESFASENDDDDEPEERLDNVLQWTFAMLTEKGRSKKEISEGIVDGNYKKINFGIDDGFLDGTFLGFSYLVPDVSDGKLQQKYYSSVFRNINIQGQALLPQESRASLYFLDKDLANFFNPKFAHDYSVKGLSGETRVDFVRCSSLLSQYKKDGDVSRVARGYKPIMERYYEEYIYSVVSDLDERYGKFSAIFQDRKYERRLSNLDEALKELGVPKKFPSIIDLDMHFFGLVFEVVFNNKKIDFSKKDEISESIGRKIEELKSDPAHVKAPSHLRYLRARIADSVLVYRRYAA